MSDNNSDKDNNNYQGNVPPYDELIELQGGFGKYQALSTTAIIACINGAGWFVYGQAYLLLLPKWQCYLPSDPNHTWLTGDAYELYCNPTFFCENPEVIFYEPDWKSPISLHNWMQKYHLECAEHITISLFGMMFFLGWGLFSAVFPPLADKYGRRNIFIYACILNLFCLIAPMVLPGVEFKYVIVLIGIMFLNGVQSAAKMPIGYNYLLEFIPKRKQNFYGTIWMFLDGSTYIFMTLIYRYITNNWLYIFAIAVVQLLTGLILFVLYVPESPKWLYDQQRYKDCFDVMSMMAKWNGIKDFEEGPARMLLDQGQMVEPRKSSIFKKQDVQEDNIGRTTCIIEEVAYNRRNKINLGLMTILWVSSAFGYYLVGYQLKYIKGDLYINGIVSSASELVAYYVSLIVLQKYGLKSTFFCSFCLSSIGMTSLIFYQHVGDNQFILSLFILGAKFGVSAAFNIIYLGNVILFPINIVATSFGICNFCARIITISAPFFAELKPIEISQYTFVGFCVMSIFASAALIEKKTSESEDRETLIKTFKSLDQNETTE